MNSKSDTIDAEKLDDQIVMIIGFATCEAFEAGRNFEGTWSNSPLIHKYGNQVQALLLRERQKGAELLWQNQENFIAYCADKYGGEWRELLDGFESELSRLSEEESHE